MATNGTTSPVFVALNNGKLVLAHSTGKYAGSCKKFANRLAAEHAVDALNVLARVYQAPLSRVFYVEKLEVQS